MCKLSPHHHQMYHQMETLMSNVMIKPKLAVIVGSGDTELSVRDSKPGLQPESGEDHMEESWLVDKSSVTARLPKDCFSIGTTCRGIVGMKDGAAVELENLFDEVISLSTKKYKTDFKCSRIISFVPQCP